jgi:hypothetical protein
MISFNLPDPTEQEKVRRGSHKYVAEAGVHGRYVKDIYIRQEYPKTMDKTPYPQLKDFSGKTDAEILLEHARKRWDERQMHSIVKNKAEEDTWLSDHSDDPILTPGAYPKTMDRTPAPRVTDCNGLEDYRLKRQEWRDQIAASIVHDETEEQLWLEEHAVPVATAPKRGKPAQAGKGKAKAA